jgi:hypothetical protein
MKFYYVVDYCEKVIDPDGQISSGDNIKSFECKTEKQAKKIGMEGLKDESIWSVWILKLRADYDDDPYGQWCRYKDDKEWRIHDGGWIH